MNIRKMQTASGGPLKLTSKEQKYLEWSKMTPEQKREYRNNRAKTHLQSGPNITNFWEAFQTYIGNRDPENPHLQTGDVPNPGMKNPKQIVQTATRIGRTLEDYLKATKVSAPILEGSTMARSSYATDRFIGGRLFQNTLPEEAMKIQGHGMAKSPTIQDALARLRYILDNGIKGKFYTAPLKVSKEAAMAGEAIGTGGATPYFDGHFLITGSPGQMINSVDDIGTIYINDAYENEEALKAAQKLQQYLQQTYPKINFKLYSQGFKQGGKMNILEFLKNGSGIHIKKKNRGKFTSYCGGKVTDECIQKGKNSSNPAIRKRATFAANARKWKHKDGGVLYIFQEGGKTSWWNKAINFMNNSGLGDIALNALSTYTQNKQIGASSDVAKAKVDKDKASKIQQANLAAEQEANDIQQNNVNPENPNAMSGDIVKNFIKNKLLSQKMALINQESNQEKAEIDWQTQQLKNQNTTNMWAGIGSTLMQGLGHVGQYMGNKQQTNVSNT